jgi:hypothetical protein
MVVGRRSPAYTPPVRVRARGVWRFRAVFSPDVKRRQAEKRPSAPARWRRSRRSTRRRLCSRIGANEWLLHCCRCNCAYFATFSPAGPIGIALPHVPRRWPRIERVDRACLPRASPTPGADTGQRRGIVQRGKKAPCRRRTTIASGSVSPTFPRQRPFCRPCLCSASARRSADTSARPSRRPPRRTRPATRGPGRVRPGRVHQTTPQGLSIDLTS